MQASTLSSAELAAASPRLKCAAQRLQRLFHAPPRCRARRLMLLE